MTQQRDGCVKPARGPIVEDDPTPDAAPTRSREERRMQARVGHPAPDFEATAYVEGKGFEPVKLSDHKGRWIVLCFYPGDFTFV